MGLTGSPNVTKAAGTTNQISVSPSSGTGQVTFSTPQDIATTSSPTFATLTLTKSQANLFTASSTTVTSTGFTNSGIAFPTIVSNSLSFTEIAEAGTDGGSVTANTITLNFSAITSGSPGTTILNGFANTLNVTQANGIVSPDITNVVYTTNITNTGGGSNTYVRGIEFYLNVFGAFQQNSYATMVFRTPVLDVGATINTQNCILIEDQGSKPAFVGQGTGDAIRWAGTLKVGANSAITGTFKLEVTTIARFGTGIAIASTTAPTAGNEILMGGTAARGIIMQRHTTSNTAGNSLTITTGGATSGATDKNAGQLILSTGTATGNGTAGVDFYTVPANQGAGTADRTATNTHSINGAGIISKYNNIATVSNGVPSELATVDSVTQSAAITATTIYTPATTGLFRLSVYLQITRAATTSSVLGGATGVVITYKDGDGNVAQSITMGLNSNTGTIVTTSATNTTATNLNGTMVIYANSSTAIQYAIGYTSVGVTSMQFAAHLKVEAL